MAVVAHQSSVGILLGGEIWYHSDMINQKSIEAVAAATFSSHFRKPLYDSYCFSNIPGTIEKLLTGDTNNRSLPTDVVTHDSYDKVVLFFVDAFGWRFFERYKDKYPVLQRFINDGVVSKMTSQFPSTTAAHVTTIHTGKRVDESGVFEWFYYEPKVDAMIAPLLFSYAGDTERNSLTDVISPHELYPNETIYRQLEAKGVQTYLFRSNKFTPTPYDDVVTQGLTHVNAFEHVTTAWRDLSQAVMSEPGKGYFYFYLGDIDAMGHEYGPNSKEFAAAVDSFFTDLEELFVNVVAGKCGNTLMMMTADHGQTDVDPATTIYINKALPEIMDWTKTNKNGDLLVVGGGCRDMFLYIKDEYQDIALTQLQELLENKAEVYLVEDLITQGFFGDTPSDVLTGRLGNICILPYKHESVYWWEVDRFEQNFYGHHGGLTPDEMDTIFLTLAL